MQHRVARSEQVFCNEDKTRSMLMHFLFVIIFMSVFCDVVWHMNAAKLQNTIKSLNRSSYV